MQQTSRNTEVEEEDDSATPHNSGSAIIDSTPSDDQDEIPAPASKSLSKHTSKTGHDARNKVANAKTESHAKEVA